MFDNLELVGFSWFGVLLLVCLGFNYTLLYCLLAYSLFMFLCLALVMSSWLALVFFLVYVGALLVLFFFIFSLSNKYLIPSKNWSWLWLGSVVMIFSVSFLSFRELSGSGMFNKIAEKSMTKNNLQSLSVLLVFMCLVVWNLNQMNFLNNSSLRPFS